MIKRMFLACLALAFLAIGAIGLVLPMLPGLPLLCVGALLAVSASPALGARLDRHPGWRRWHRRWRAGAGLPLLHRLQLAFWLSADAATRPLRRS